MGGPSPKLPDQPDPRETAEAQYEFNKKAFEDVFRMGSLDTSGPLGGVSFARNAEGLPTSQHTSLSPGLQGLYDTAIGAAGSQFGMMPTGPFDPNVDGSGIRDAYVRQGIANVEDLWGRQDNERKVTYGERGIPIGSELYNTAESEVGEGRNKYLQGITDAAWQAGANEEQRLYGNALTEYNLPFATGANYLNAAMAIPAALQGLPPAIQNLQPGNFADTANRNYQNQIAQYNQAAANQSAGLASFLRFGGSVLGSALPLMFSDERLKEDIEPIGELHDGQEPLPIYEWSYKDDPERHIGPMAQDVLETNPELVAQHPSGYLMIDANAPTRPSLAAVLRAGMQ